MLVVCVLSWSAATSIFSKKGTMDEDQVSSYD